MSCVSSSTPGIPFLFKGGNHKKSQINRKSKRKSKQKRRKKSKRRKGTKHNRFKQGGGVGLFGDVATNAVTVANSLTGSLTGNSALYVQPANQSYGNGNRYMV